MFLHYLLVITIVSVVVIIIMMIIFYFTILQPHVDFGLKLLGADVMAIPGLYRFVQVRFFGCLMGCSFLKTIYIKKDGFYIFFLVASPISFQLV